MTLRTAADDDEAHRLGAGHPEDRRAACSGAESSARTPGHGTRVQDGERATARITRRKALPRSEAAIRPELEITRIPGRREQVDVGRRDQPYGAMTAPRRLRDGDDEPRTRTRPPRPVNIGHDQTRVTLAHDSEPSGFEEGSWTLGPPST